MHVTASLKLTKRVNDTLDFASSPLHQLRDHYISTMARGPAKKVVIDSEETNIVEAVSTSKKGRKSTKTEVKEVVKVETKVELGSDEEPLVTPKKTSAKKQVPIKRKVKAEDDGEVEEKVPKKRKTKGEDMPITARTVVGSLSKAMYIGAHISAAGGMSFIHAFYQAASCGRIPRSSKLDCKVPVLCAELIWSNFREYL